MGITMPARALLMKTSLFFQFLYEIGIFSRVGNLRKLEWIAAKSS